MVRRQGNGASARLVRQAPLAERTAYRPASGADTQHGELHRQPAHPQQGTEPQIVALLGNISDHAQAAFRDREEQIAQAHQRSTSIITGLIIAAILLLVFSYLIIQKHLKRDSLLRKKYGGCH